MDILNRVSKLLPRKKFSRTSRTEVNEFTRGGGDSSWRGGFSETLGLFDFLPREGPRDFMEGGLVLDSSDEVEFAETVCTDAALFILFGFLDVPTVGLDWEDNTGWSSSDSMIARLFVRILMVAEYWRRKGDTRIKWVK